MPIYEYRCLKCGRPSSFFTRSVKESLSPVCSHCSGTQMQRLISPFAHHKSLKTIHKESGPPSGYPSPEYYSDPRNIGRHVEDSFRKHGMEVPEQVKESIHAAREGELPQGLDL